VHLALGLVALIGAATALAAIFRSLGLSEPLMLVLVGIAVSYLPFVPDVSVDPELILLGLLPPLLYTAAIRTSLIDFRANRRPIGLLSVGLVLFTAFGVACVVWWMLPVPFASAVAIGAIVAPPDAVAATAVARRIGMPRRIVTLLEGESLFNDATALVTLRTAIAAASGSVGILHTGGEFALAAGGGAVIGVALALLLGMVRRRIKDPVIDTTLSFLAPFLAYLPAEQIHASGVIAVVVCGLILGHKAPEWQSAASRIAERTNWGTIEFILENVVFLLIGLQVRDIVSEAWNSSLDHTHLIATAAAVLGSVIVLRMIWVFPATYIPRMIPRVGANDPPPPFGYPLIVGWAGMRGAVTLAAVLLLPQDTPLLDVLKLLAIVVVTGTLLLQGTTLPWLVRWLKLRGPSAAEDALQQAGLLQRAAEAGLQVLDERADADTPPQVIEALRARLAQRTNASWERLGPTETERRTPSESYRRLRLQMLQAERAEVLAVRDSGLLDHEVLQVVMGVLDLEESMIDRLDEAEDELRAEDLRASLEGACEHLRDALQTQIPDHPGLCQECLDEGLEWVHLRMCLHCGHVACCDSSPGNHATKHFVATKHPVMRSVEPGESWRWCYPDSLLG